MSMQCVPLVNFGTERKRTVQNPSRAPMNDDMHGDCAILAITIDFFHHRDLLRLWKKVYDLYERRGLSKGRVGLGINQ